MSNNYVSSLIEDDPDGGIFRVDPSIFSDEKIFRDEIECIFNNTWNYLGLESQLPNPNDFLSTWIARTPILVTRAPDRSIKAMVNACRHKGAVLTHSECGNRGTHICPYHGWMYDALGKNKGIKDRQHGRYSKAFENATYDLIPLGAVESYKGLIFGSLSADVPPLEEFLGELRPFLDLALEQGPAGMELVPGRSTYTYEGNWKLQMDNGLDQYHLTSTHTSFLQVQRRRKSGQGNVEAKQFEWQKRFDQQGGLFQFKYGHAAIWLDQAEVEKRPIYPSISEIKERKGEVYADWVLKLRNLLVFPNLQIADSTSLILRTFRPISVSQTEMRVFCLAPKGESAEQRRWRIRQFEDFFNASGLATPDDTVTYEACQRGLASAILRKVEGYSRGMTATRPGGDEYSAALGCSPVGAMSGKFRVQAETCLHPAYREWSRLMEAGSAGKGAYGGKP